MAKKLTQAQKLAQAYNRQYPDDLEFPFKIVAPKHRISPLRFKSREDADEVFTMIINTTSAQAIYTHTEVNPTVSTKIIGYSSGEVYRKE